MVLYLDVFVELGLVTDRQTDRHTITAYTVLAWRGTTKKIAVCHKWWNEQTTYL